MSVVLLIAAAVAAQGVSSKASAPPPVVVPVQEPRAQAIDVPAQIVAVAPPGPPTIVRAQAMLGPVVVVPVRVRITGGTQLLLDDTLRIARNASAGFTQSRNEAPERLCTTTRYYGSAERQSLNVQLYLRDSPEEGSAVNVSVSWQRPSGTASCGPDGSRTVSLSETVPLKEGQSATLQGDAGLTVTLSRR
jgi:hypothetical protein